MADHEVSQARPSCRPPALDGSFLTNTRALLVKRPRNAPRALLAIRWAGISDAYGTRCLTGFTLSPHETLGGLSGA